MIGSGTNERQPQIRYTAVLQQALHHPLSVAQAHSTFQLRIDNVVLLAFHIWNAKQTFEAHLLQLLASWSGCRVGWYTKAVNDRASLADNASLRCLRHMTGKAVR